jgi:16S rRNA (uracil1498-N3)-methyltransferase
MKSTPRLFFDGDLGRHSEHVLSAEQGRYLVSVLRLRAGDPVRLFNSRDGEWTAHLGTVTKRHVTVRSERKIADVQPPPDIDFLFAPIKHARLDYVVQKSTELGARRLRPVITQRTMVERVNLDRMRANAAEAAEQCNVVYVPEVFEPVQLKMVVAGWEQDRVLVYCDETAPVADPLAALKSLKPPAALLIGPEGGFTEEERHILRQLPSVTVLSLGPRIMRADTAAVAALALMQASFGDWHHEP